MTTVNFTCGHCGRLMAVETQDLGKQVECPHCQQVIQAPAAEQDNVTFAAPPSETPINLPDVLGVVLSMEIPDPPALPNMPFEPGAVGAEKAHSQPPPLPADMPAAAEQPVSHNFAFAQEKPAVDAAATHLPEPSPSPSPRRARKSMLVPLVLMVLVPWAFVGPALAFFVGTRWHAPLASDAHPLEWLLDPDPKDGAPKRIQRDLELPKKLEASLKQSLEVGDVRITPLSVEWSERGDLLLRLLIRNRSTDTEFNPLPESFLRKTHLKTSKTAVYFDPYTFLTFGDERIDGGALTYLKGPPSANEPADSGVLRPGEELTVLLSTPPHERKATKKIAGSAGPIVWRVQVRRGLALVRGREVSATAVIGVTFDARAIQ